MTESHTLYKEPYRQQFHFSPPVGWMNDPNGLVYYEGEYHLFYQFSPDVARGPMHWGHAVSADLLHWENLPIGLYPDANGAIWSGCAVVDADNTSGLVPGGGLVAIFSYENQTQGIASSTDKGRTWTMYPGNPVIEARAKDFRDPKVIWDAEHSRWAMVISAVQEVQFLTSPNLIDWTYQSSFSGGHLQGVWEVPDFFPLEIDGETKWVLVAGATDGAPALGPGTQYFLGHFDGTAFTAEDHPLLWLEFGPDNYAGTIWDSAPDGKRIYIGWLNNWLYAFNVPASTWRGAATLPREFTLVKTADGIRLKQTIPAVFQQLRAPLGTWNDLEVSGTLKLDGVQSQTLEIIAEIAPGNAASVGIDVHVGAGGQTRIVYDAAQAQLEIHRANTTDAGEIKAFNPRFGAPVALDGAPLQLHIFVDVSSVEVLAQDGIISLSATVFDPPADTGVTLSADGGTVTFTKLEIYALSSVWG